MNGAGTIRDTSDNRTVFTASELMAMELPEPKCVVHRALTEGLNLLVARPKLGKSWLALQLSNAISTGTFALGTLPVLEGDVLYLAMEDNRRRLKSRMLKLLAGRPAPKRLTLATVWPRMDEGGIDKLRDWIAGVEIPRLIVLDTLAKLRSTKARQADRYAEDYQDVGEIQKLAEELGVAVLALHHDRKAQAEDAMDDVSGSIGITAAADTILLMRRERGKHDALLSVHGRDIDEQEIGLEWDTENCRWSVIEKEIRDLRMSEERRAVLSCVQQHGPITPKEVADRLGKAPNNIKQLLYKMSKDGEVKSSDGKYTAVT